MLDRLPAEMVEWRTAPVVARSRRPLRHRGRCGRSRPGGSAWSASPSTIAAEAGTGPTVPVHGDFYESQILVDGGRVCGVLDVDAARTGDRLDDLGCLIGHLSVLAQLDHARAGAINRLGARYLASFERTVDAADLRYRTAAVVISLATGPHRVQDRNWPALTRRLIDLAERWLLSARAVR